MYECASLVVYGACVFEWLSVYVYVFECLGVYVFVRSSVLVCVFVCLSVCLSVCLCACVSVVLSRLKAYQELKFYIHWMCLFVCSFCHHHVQQIYPCVFSLS